MKASEQLIEAIKQFEGIRSTAYRDAAGVWTIGYGHTANVKSGQRVSISEAEELLRQDLQPVEQYVNALGVCQTQGQFDPLGADIYYEGMPRPRVRFAHPRL